MKTSNNCNLNILEGKDKLKNLRGALNDNFEKIDNLIKKTGTNIYVASTLPEIENRLPNTFYFKVINEYVKPPVDDTNENCLLSCDGESISSTENENIIIST